MTLDSLFEHYQPESRKKFHKFENDVAYEFGKDFLSRDETLRSYARSNQLFAQGRTEPGEIVTNAKAGWSYHNFGFAGDYYPRLHGQIVYDFMRVPILATKWKRVETLAELAGLECGGRWVSPKDHPHFQDADAPSLAHCRLKWPKGYRP